MKKIVCISLFCLFSIFIYASEVSDLLHEALGSYESGDVTTAIQKLESAKIIMENEKLSSLADDYVEVKNWDIVKLKKSEYLGKKIKIQASFISFPTTGTVYLIPISTSNTYDESLIDKLLTLQLNNKYIFYGTVQDDGIMGPKLHIEAIE